MFRSLSLAVIAAAAAAATPSPAHAPPSAPPWLGAPFSAEPADLLRAARAEAAADQPAVILLEDVRYTFDAAGRATRRERMVYLVLTAEGAGGWGGIEA